MEEGLYFGANRVTFLNLNVILVVEIKPNLIHNLFFVVCFVNLYMLRAYLGSSSGGTTVANQDNRQSTIKNNKYQLLYTCSCPS